MELLRSVKEIVEEYGLLHSGDGVIVGCSGGPDSMCLLHLLMELKPSMDLTLHVVHLEHGFRGEASLEDAEYVKDFCRREEIPCTICQMQVRELAKQQGLSEETAGREARYRCFFEARDRLLQQMRDQGIVEPAVKIAVAHNKNDQAETILMRILRGTGLDGLKGMELMRQDGIIRPLLTTGRNTIEAYCEEYGLNPRRDHTNEETEYTRNRVRLELIPYMKEHFNGGVEDALIRLGSISAEAMEVIREAADQREATLHQDEAGRVDDRKGLVALNHGLRHEILRRALGKTGSTRNVSSVHLHQIDDLLGSGAASGRVELPEGYTVAVSYDRILWQSPARPEGTAAGRIVTRTEILKSPEGGKEIKGLPEHIKCFDGKKIREALGQNHGEIHEEMLTVRTRKAGDFIRPLGSPGRKKLQDWFVDQKIPRQDRDRTPLVCIGSEVLWIVGHRISENYKVDEQTKELVFVEFHQ